jgi:hypothetical protein
LFLFVLHFLNSLLQYLFRCAIPLTRRRSSRANGTSVGYLTSQLLLQRRNSASGKEVQRISAYTYRIINKKHKKLPEAHEYSECAILLTGVSSGQTRLSSWRDAV